MKINIYVVDDLFDNITRFEEIAKELRWLKTLASLGISEVIEAFRLRRDLLDTTKIESIIIDSGLREDELDKVKSLFANYRRIIDWDRMLKDVSNVEINVASFHMNSSKAYLEALNSVKSCEGICFWVVDVIWAKRFEILDYLEYPVRDLWNNNVYDRAILGALNISYQLIIRNIHSNCSNNKFYVVHASTSGPLDSLFTIPSSQLKEFHKRYFIPVRESIASIGAPSFIVRILKEFWCNYIAMPINKIRFLSSSNNDKRWFKEDYENSSNPEKILVPHNFPYNENYFSSVSQYLFENLKVTDRRYNFFVHEGLKSVCLSGNKMGAHTVYSIAILADAQSDQSPLYLDSKLPTYIPLLKNSSLIIDKGNFDFAESLYDFFVEFFKNVQVQLFYEECSLKFVSSQPVTGKADSLFTRICDHLIFYSQYGQWQDAHTTSRPLAQCIEFGGWGLVGEQEVVRQQTGAFLITMQDKEVRFSWEED